MILLIIAILVALVLFYALHGRAWLKTKPWAQGFFDRVEPIEIALFKKSETILVGRFLWVGSALVTAYDTVSLYAKSIGLDWTPITWMALKNVPEELRGMIVTTFVGALGLLINWLRKRTTKPIEIVAVSEQTVPPEVAAAVAVAEQASADAVAAVADATPAAKA